jgi:hypothetical protein
MTPTGHKDRAAVIAERIKNRGRTTEHHTRELVRTELPDEMRALFLEMADKISMHSLEIIELKRQLADVSAALRDAVARRVA